MPELKFTNPCCLIVEDNLTNQALFKGINKRFNVRCENTENGIEALNILTEMENQSFMPDYIILDLMMPEMDGKEFLEAFKETPFYDKVPIVVISATRDKDLAMEVIMKHHPHKYFSKPINPGDLSNFIEHEILKKNSE